MRLPSAPLTFQAYAPVIYTSTGVRTLSSGDCRDVASLGAPVTTGCSCAASGSWKCCRDWAQIVAHWMCSRSDSSRANPPNATLPPATKRTRTNSLALSFQVPLLRTLCSECTGTQRLCTAPSSSAAVHARAVSHDRPSGLSKLKTSGDCSMSVGSAGSTPRKALAPEPVPTERTCLGSPGHCAA